jgi:hypothetical protein
MSSGRLLLKDPPLALRLKIRFDQWPALIRYRRWKRPRDADFFLLSYPKAGRTWLRVMMAGLFAQHFGRPELATGEAGDDLYPNYPGVPRIGAKHDGWPQKKTAAEILSDKSEFADCRVIFLVRDIRDLAVSNYFQVTRRVHRYEGDIASYIRWPRGSVDGMLRYYNIWAAQRGVPRDFMLVRYEDLRRDTVTELGRVARFVGLTNVRPESLERAVEHGAFESMKKRESSRPADGSSLAAGRPGDAESFKTRKGKIGGYTEYLSTEDVAWLNRRIDTELDPYYGYSSAAEPGPVRE